MAVGEFPPEQRHRIRRLFSSRTKAEYRRRFETIQAEIESAGKSSVASGSSGAARSSRPTLASATELLDTVGSSEEFFAGDDEAKATRDRLIAQRASGEYTVAMARAADDDTVIGIDQPEPEPNVEVDWLDLGDMPAAPQDAVAPPIDGPGE